MSRAIDEIENEVLNLPLKERAILVEHLIVSLDKGEDVDAEELWLQEAEKRYEKYKEGKTTSRPLEQVLQDIKSKIK